MQNKILINKIKNNAELAQAAYGYFGLVDKKFDNKEEYKDRKGDFITLHDILDSTYNGYKTPNHKLGNPEELDGDMTPTQAKRFFEKYDILIHQPNTESGFSATLFGEKRKQTNTESKEVSYTNDYGYTNYILAFRGTEPSNMGDIKADVNLTFKNLPKKQYFDMLLFYYQCIGKIPFYVDSTSMPQDKDSLEYKL